MDRAVFLKWLWPCLLVGTALAGVASAAPTGTADRPQILSSTTTIGGLEQSTFRTTDPLLIYAVYYDNAPACSGVAPTFVQLFIFNLEGLFIGQFDASSSPVTFSGDPSTKYRRLIMSFPSIGAIPLAPGDYKYTFLARDCTNTKSIVAPEFVVFSVFAP